MDPGAPEVQNPYRQRRARPRGNATTSRGYISTTTFILIRRGRRNSLPFRTIPPTPPPTGLGAGRCPGQIGGADNVNSVIRRVGQTVHAERPGAKFGVSPFGIYRPGVPSGTTALAWICTNHPYARCGEMDARGLDRLPFAPALLARDGGRRAFLAAVEMVARSRS